MFKTTLNCFINYIGKNTMKNYTVEVHSNEAYEIKLTDFDKEFSEAKLIAKVNEDEQSLIEELMFQDCWDGEILETMGMISVSANNYVLVVSDNDTGKTQQYRAADVSSELISVVSSKVPYYGYEEVSSGMAGSFKLTLPEEFDIRKLQGNITQYDYLDDSGAVYQNSIIDHFFYEGFNNLGSPIIEITTDGMSLDIKATSILINTGEE